MSTALENLAVITDGRSRRSSSWDRTGGNVDALTDIPPGGTAVLLDTRGPGKVTHIWLTVMEYPGHDTLLRDLVIRMFWEDERLPSVEVPLGDFFGLGHTLPPPFYMDRQLVITSAVLLAGVHTIQLPCKLPRPESSRSKNSDRLHPHRLRSKMSPGMINRVNSCPSFPSLTISSG